MGTMDYGYLDHDLPGREILDIVGELPKRWGRMDKLSRLAVVEVGRALGKGGLLICDDGRLTGKGGGGLIGGTRFGSIATDLAYAESLKQGPEMASPTLFSYTLPNIALAEAASHYGLTGPVYSIYAGKPLAAAEKEARRWLLNQQSLDFMVAGELDIYPAYLDRAENNLNTTSGDQGRATVAVEIISVNFMIVS